MKSPNLYAIRRQLPHGSVSQIAEKLGVSVNVVSEFFNKGWHKNLTDSILTEAIAIIQGEYPGEDLMSEIEALGLTGGSAFIPKKKRKIRESDGGIGGLGVVIAVVAAAVIMIPGLFDQIKALFNNRDSDMPSDVLQHPERYK